MNLNVKLPGLNLKNPIMTSSGTSGYGMELSALFDLNVLGTIILKATTLHIREGNALPRVAETHGGMLNSIGLQNPGVDDIIHTHIPRLQAFDFKVIANVAGNTLEEYVEVARRMSKVDKVGAIELNISCPNVKEGGIVFGTDPKMVYEVTKAVKKVSLKPVYVKLSPNVTDIVSIALEAERAGADGLSMINTLLGMSMDLNTGRPLLGNKTGGMSGPALKPIALRMIYDVYKHVKIPIIGMGGIQNANDVLEFLYAGASAVAIGTQNFINPYVCKDIVEALPDLLLSKGFHDINQAIGYAHRKE